MFVAPICTMGGAIAANMATVRRTRESNETPKACRDEGKRCAHCSKCNCKERGTGHGE